MIACPKCGFERVPSEECPRCGIIISKYRERIPTTSTQPTEAHHPQKDGSDQAAKGKRPSSSQGHAAGYPDRTLARLSEKAKILCKNLVDRFTPDRGQGNQLADAVFRALLILVITAVAYTGLLYVLKVMWLFYTATPVGEQFVGGFTRKAQGIVYLLEQASCLFALEVTMTAFVICLAIGAVCRLLHITSSTYHSIGSIGRILLCGLPLAAVVASYIQPRYGFEIWGISYAATVLPTLCVFHVCFGISDALLPESGELWRRAAPLKVRVIGKIMEWIGRANPTL